MAHVGAHIRRLTLIVVSVMMIPAIMIPGMALAQSQPADPVALMQQMIELTKNSRFKEAIDVNKQLIAALDAMGAGDNPLQAAAYMSLGNLYRFDGQFDEAEQQLDAALAMREKLLGRDHPDVAASLISQVDLLLATGRMPAAEPKIKRALAILRKSLPADSPDIAMATLTQARILHARAQFAEAEAITAAALDIFRRKLGLDHPFVGVALNNLAEAKRALGQVNAAEALLLEANTVNARAYGENSPLVSTGLNNLAELKREQGKFAEAESIRQREIRMVETQLGADNPALVPSLNNYATLLTARGRPQEAEQVIRRALSILKASLPADHPDLAVVYNNLGDALSGQERFAEAEEALMASLKIREQRSGDFPAQLATVLTNLSVLFEQQKRFAEAEPLARRALALNERQYGANHPAVATGLNNLGVILDNQDKHATAEPLLRRALAIRQQVLGDRHPDVANVFSNLGSNQLDRQDWRGAFQSFESARKIWLDRRAGMAGADRASSGARGISEIDRNPDAFFGLIRAADGLRKSGQTDGTDAWTEAAFEAAQWAMGSEAAGAVQQLGARLLAGNAKLAEMVREQQDLANRWVALDKALVAARAETGDRRDTEAITRLQASLDAASTRALELETELAASFPDFAAAVAPKPMRLSDVRARLKESQTLVILLPMRLTTFVWAITRDRVVWQRRDLPAATVKDAVLSLRCGLDRAAWTGPTAAHCQKQFGAQGEARLLPFDVNGAHALYKQLFTGLESLIEGRDVLLVTSGAFTTLPLQVLVTQPPPAGTAAAMPMRSVAWLTKSSAISVLPSVGSLAVLSRSGTPSQARKPFLGMGNPLVSGANGNDRRAWAQTNCGSNAVVLAAAEPARAMDAPAGLTLSALRSLESLRRAAPLPETATELCTVAQALNASDADVLLGARSTERQLKDLNTSGALSDYRVLHFATHGLIADETRAFREELAEPSLLLTPPEGEPVASALAIDDGLLTASEVSLLKLDANWVILSACNTASGGTAKAEALSGLARAFFFAGARSLLVSHWPVFSIAAVKLTTTAFAALANDAKLSRAGALQVAMNSMIDSPTAYENHPSYWAPFIVVGEGGG
jgi:CHAT domain-containing protein/tetratricopeptide (TPR) repeat protein